MPAPAPPPIDSLADDTFDAFAARPDAVSDDVPVEGRAAPRSRLRRGGPRTPLPLIPVIGVCAGIALAYVAQTAHVTQATYQATTLSAEHTKLQQDDRQLGDALERLRSAERIDAAAMQLGMRPAGRWAYVTASAPAVNVPGAPPERSPGGPTDSVQRLIAALSGSFGTQRVEAAGR